MVILKITFFLFILKIGHCHSLTIEESRKILDLHYKETQRSEVRRNNETTIASEGKKNLSFDKINDYVESTSIVVENVTNEYEDNVTLPPEQIQEQLKEDNFKLQRSLSEALSPMSEKVVGNEDNEIELMEGNGTETKEPDDKEPPTIFEELFIDTLTKRLTRKKGKFFDTKFENIPVEESFETLGRLCHRFLQHYRYFCVQQPITDQNEMRCRGYQQDCSHFFRPKSPLQRITEKLQSNIRLGYYKLYDLQKTMSPFI